MTQTLKIRRPDDWHVHLRDGVMLEAVVAHTARQFARAIVMPNLAPPVTTVEAAAAYRDRILAAAPEDIDFMPLMTCYLTDNTDPEEVRRGFDAGVFTAAKLYPAGATTNSDSGVTDVANIRGVLEVMAEIGMILCVHGEVTHSEIDIFDREAVFIEKILRPLVADLPDLKVVFEHITTAEAVDFVANAPANIGATITPQHLHINRNAMLVGGMRPHAYCLPVAKREKHRLALVKAATSGSEKFFLGTDSAPHLQGDKESACGCAGIYNAPYALESYLAIFEAEDAIAHFEGFASLNGPRFYDMPVNESYITLIKAEQEPVPATYETGRGPVVPFHAGERLAWRFDGLA